MGLVEPRWIRSNCKLYLNVSGKIKFFNYVDKNWSAEKETD